MASLGEQLRDYWISIGMKVRPGVSRETIESFQQTYGVRLPLDLRDYYQTVDGMESGQTDNDLLEFLPLHAVKSIAEELVEFGGIPDYRRIKETLPDAQRYFVVIDYMIRSHVYAIELSSDLVTPNTVIWICGPDWKVIAPSFSHFAERYLTDTKEILFPR